MAAPRIGKLPHGVYAICDWEVHSELGPEEKAALFLGGGAAVIQLRAKQVNLRDFIALSRKIVVQCRAKDVPCLIDDRVDVALVCEADGVHLGEGDLSPKEARQVLGPSRIIGVTVRNPEQARRA